MPLALLNACSKVFITSQDVEQLASGILGPDNDGCNFGPFPPEMLFLLEIVVIGDNAMVAVVTVVAGN